MDEFIRSGRAIDWILILIALEALAVLGYRAFTGRGPAAVRFYQQHRCRSVFVGRNAHCACGRILGLDRVQPDGGFYSSPRRSRDKVAAFRRRITCAKFPSASRRPAFSRRAADARKTPGCQKPKSDARRVTDMINGRHCDHVKNGSARRRVPQPAGRYPTIGKVTAMA